MTDQLTTEVLQTEYSIPAMERRIAEKEARRKQGVKDEIDVLALEQRLASEAPPAPPPPPAEDDGFINNTLEVLGTAGEEAIEQMAQTVGELGNSAQQLFDPEGTGLLSTEIGVFNKDVSDRGVRIPFTDYRIDLFGGAEWKEMVQEYEKATGELAGDLSNLDLPDVDRPDSVAGNMAKDFLKFAAVFAFTRRALPAGSTKATSIARNVSAGAIADFSAFDPHEERLSDLLTSWGKDNPVFDNAVTQYLSVDETDTELEGRMKNAAEGLGIGFVADRVLASVKWLKGRRAARKLRDLQADEALDDTIRPQAEPEAPKATPDEPKRASDARAEQQAKIDDAEARVTDEGETLDGIEFNSSELTARELRARLGIDPAKRNELALKIAEGGEDAVDNLLDFNANTYDWAKVADEGDPDAVKRLINTTSEVFADMIDEAKGGTQSLRTTAKLAKQVGGTAEQVLKLADDVRGKGGVAARMQAAHKVMLSSAHRLQQLAKAAGRDGATAADEAALFRHIEMHAMIQAQVKGSQTEIARALHAMRAMKAATAESFSEFDNVVRQLGGGNPELRKRLAQRLAEMKSVANLNKVVRKSAGRRWLDMAIEVYVNGLLSSFSTLNLNNISNTLKVIEGVAERYAAMGIGMGRNGIRRAVGLAPVERVKLREANAAMVGTIRGLEVAFGLPIRQILKDIRAGKGFDFDSVNFKDSPTTRAFLDESPQLDVRQRIDADTRKAISAENVPFKLKNDALNARAINALGKLIRIPGRLIITSDEVFKNIGFHQELAARSYRRAAALADDAKLTGAKRERFMAKEMERDLLDPPEDLRLEAMDFARYNTFQADLESGFAKGIEDFINRNPVAKFVVPFYRTPVNIVKQTVLERTPLALFRRQQNNLLRQIAKGGPEADIALARVAAGSTVIGMGMMWAMGGKITGSGSSNVLNQNTETLDGIPPYSMKVGDEWIQYNRLEPMGMLLGLSADLAEAAMNWDPDEDDGPYLEAATVALTVVTTNITDKTWFKGVADLVTALEDPKRYLQNYARNLGSTVITPYSSLLRRINVEHDEYAREAWSFMDKWKASIPGMSGSLAIRRDYLGDPQPRQSYFGPAWASPVAKGVETTDPVRQELARLAYDVRKPNKDLFRTGRDVTPVQYSEFLRLRGTHKFDGKSMQDELRLMIASPEYRTQLSDDGREQVLKTIVQKYGQAAKKKMLTDDSQLMKEFRVAKEQSKLDLLAIGE